MQAQREAHENERPADKPDQIPSPESPMVQPPAVIAHSRIIRAINPNPIVDLLEGSAAIGTFQVDLEAGTVEWSDEIFRRYAIDPSSNATLVDAFQRVHPEDRARLSQAVSEGIANKTGYGLEFRIISPGGEVMWNSIRARVTGKHVFGVVFDVTALKQASENERRAREQITTVLESISEAFIALDRDWRFTYVNRRVLNRLQKSREEVIGANIWDVFPAAMKTGFFAEYQRVMNERIPRRFQTPYAQLDGSTTWYDVHAYPTPDGIAALVQDITDSRSATEGLRLAVEQLRLIEEAVNAGTWVFDVQTGISHWPPGISALWGLPAKHHDIALPEFVERVYAEDRDRVSAVIRLALETASPYQVEFRVVWPDRSVHWLQARGAVMTDSSGKPLQVVGIALEATQQIKTEEALRQSEKLAAAGRLAATIAHEINNPLEAVTNLLYISSHHPNLPPEVREYLQQADQELARVSHIARQTLGFYRESSHPEDVNLADSVEQVLALYRRKIAHKNITIRKRLDPLARVRGSTGELRQVISNIILNAVDAVRNEGIITIKLARKAGQVVFTVADNGPGIARDHITKIFQPFFTTKKDVGTGLGLWVTKGIVDKHGGRILVRSTHTDSRSGTIFTIRFPGAAVSRAAG